MSGPVAKDAAGPRVVAALAVGTAGGAAFDAAGLPLAWLLGSLFACLAAGLVGAPIRSPTRLRPPMAMLLGLAIGGAFTPAILAAAPSWWLSLLALPPYLAVVTGAGLVYFRRIAGYDAPTALYAAVPGGLSEMLLLGQAAGGDPRRIALAHAGRIMLTVSLMPLAFGLYHEMTGAPPATPAPPATGAAAHASPLWHLGPLLTGGLGAWWLAARLKLPVASLMGPLAFSVFVHLGGWTTVQIPAPLFAAAQVVLGAVAGCRFLGTAPAAVARFALEALGFVLLTLGIGAIFALALAHAKVADVTAVLLAFAPAGLTEMGLLAIVLGADAAFVATHQVARLSLVLALAPAVNRLTRKRLLKGPKP